MRIYRGIRLRDKTLVTVNSIELPLRLDLANHSPTGFEWGYCGSGPAQLALAILANELSIPEALKYYQLFKQQIISNLTHDSWSISSDQVRSWITGVKDGQG